MTLTYADVLTFVQHLTPTWVKPQQSMLAQIVSALTERPSFCATEVARALPDGPRAQGRQSLHGRLKRLNRFLSNPRLDEPEIFYRWYRLAVHFSTAVPTDPQLLPVLLDTTYFEPFAALIASVPCGGRALPIVFTTYHRRQLRACFPPAARWPTPDTTRIRPARRQHQPLQAASAEVHHWTSQNHIEEQLLHYLWALTTPSQQIVIVADRGFAPCQSFPLVSDPPAPVCDSVRRRNLAAPARRDGRRGQGRVGPATRPTALAAAGSVRQRRPSARGGPGALGSRSQGTLVSGYQSTV